MEKYKNLTNSQHGVSTLFRVHIAWVSKSSVISGQSAGSEVDSPTNDVRSMAGASDYVVNMLVGYDSADGNHSATMSYNVFGERLYLAGRLGSPDAFEQPFHSLDMTYFWYPTEEVTIKLKMQNLLGQSVEIEREGVTVFERESGQTFALSAEYKF